MEHESVKAITKPSSFFAGLQTKNKRDKPTGVEELRRRYQNGLDLWDGTPLTGSDLATSQKLRGVKDAKASN